MNLIHRGILVSLILAIFIFQAGAQSSRVVPLTEVLRAASANAPRLVNDSAAIGIQQNRVYQANFNWLPEVVVNYQANVGTNNNLPGGYFSYGLVPSNSRVRDEGQCEFDSDRSWHSILSMGGFQLRRKQGGAKRSSSRTGKLSKQDSLSQNMNSRLRLSINTYSYYN